MKAVIMAGGEGTRLRAVTGGAPKPLVPLLGRTMLEHVMLLLKKHGFDEVCVTLRYRAEEIIRRLPDGGEFGIKLQYRVEPQPLGTAGGVKNCEDFYGDEDFLVMSADAACDFDLAGLMRAHRERAALATLALHRAPDPLAYGLVVTDADGRIRGFVEKPTWERVVTNLVSTGIYVISPRAMAQVPRGTPFDFARDLFPRLIARGEALYGVEPRGYWRDIGSPASYYRACLDALEGRLELTPGAAFAAAPTPPRGAALSAEPPGGTADYCGALVCPCRDRAALMRALSEAMLEYGADYSDGLTLARGEYRLHIAPQRDESALRVDVASHDAELARAVAVSAAEIIAALDN